MNVTRTERGFERAEFCDMLGQDCSLQQSSAIDETERGMEHPGSSFLWLGIGKDRMHVNRKQAKELAEMMLRWVETGRLK